MFLTILIPTVIYNKLTSYTKLYSEKETIDNDEEFEKVQDYIESLEEEIEDEE